MARKRAASDSDDARGQTFAPTKKSKTTSASGPASTAPKVTSDGDEYWEISDGGKRRVVISSFRNTPMVSVREYYSDNGQMKPGKKGISLTVPQFAALVAALPAVQRSLKKLGHAVARPDYGDGAGAGAGRAKAKTKREVEEDEDVDRDGDDDDDDEDVEIKDQDEDEDEQVVKDDGEEDDEEELPAGRKKGRKEKRNKSKKNFEETSDEDED